MLKRIALALVGLCLAACSAAPAFASLEAHEPGVPAGYTAATAASISDIEAGAQRDARVDAYATNEVSPMTVRAKFFVTAKKLTEHTLNDGTKVQAATISLQPVHKPTLKPDGSLESYEQACAENRIFGEYTPGGQMSLYIINSAAHEQFEQGQEYYVDFNPASAA